VLFSLSYVKKKIKAIKRSCALHICGRAEHLIKHMSNSGAAVLSVDDVDMTRVFREVPADLVVAGNLSPLKL
jgi:uroporphyrinogen-III decarboxylase